MKHVLEQPLYFITHLFPLWLIAVCLVRADMKTECSSNYLKSYNFTINMQKLTQCTEEAVNNAVWLKSLCSLSWKSNELHLFVHQTHEYTSANTSSSVSTFSLRNSLVLSRFLKWTVVLQTQFVSIGVEKYLYQTPEPHWETVHLWSLTWILKDTVDVTKPRPTEPITLWSASVYQAESS